MFVEEVSRREAKPTGYSSDLTTKTQVIIALSRDVHRMRWNRLTGAMHAGLDGRLHIHDPGPSLLISAECVVSQVSRHVPWQQQQQVPTRAC
jgi:hypothetical protein